MQHQTYHASNRSRQNSSYDDAVRKSQKLGSGSGGRITGFKDGDDMEIETHEKKRRDRSKSKGRGRYGKSGGKNKRGQSHKSQYQHKSGSHRRGEKKGGY